MERTFPSGLAMFSRSLEPKPKLPVSGRLVLSAIFWLGPRVMGVIGANITGSIRVVRSFAISVWLRTEVDASNLKVEFSSTGLDNLFLYDGKEDAELYRQNIEILTMDSGDEVSNEKNQGANQT